MESKIFQESLLSILSRTLSKATSLPDDLHIAKPSGQFCFFSLEIVALSIMDHFLLKTCFSAGFPEFPPDSGLHFRPPWLFSLHFPYLLLSGCPVFYRFTPLMVSSSLEASNTTGMLRTLFWGLQFDECWKCIHPCNHYYNQNRVFSLFQKVPSCLYSSSPPILPPPSPRQPPICSVTTY